jgi:ABC-type proline/glycine betaine transport system permease subunit
MQATVGPVILDTHMTSSPANRYLVSIVMVFGLGVIEPESGALVAVDPKNDSHKALRALQRIQWA